MVPLAVIAAILWASTLAFGRFVAPQLVGTGGVDFLKWALVVVLLVPIPICVAHWVALRGNSLPAIAAGWFTSVVAVAVISEAIVDLAVLADREKVGLIEGLLRAWMKPLPEVVTFAFGVGLLRSAEAVAAEAASQTAAVGQALAVEQRRALRARFDPHFLFNSLSASLSLLPGAPARAASQLRNLAELFEASSREVGEWASIGEEFEFSQRYLAAERERFGDRLSWSFDAEPGTVDAVIPRFLLQPLIENAVLHGLARRPGGTVRVRVRRLNDRLCLEVEDDGDGLATSRSTVTAGTGLGIAGTRSRLQVVYEGRAWLQVQFWPGRGARTTLNLPWIDTVDR